MTAPTLLTIVAILLYATLLTPGLIDLGAQLRQLVTVLGALGAASVAVLGAVVAARRQATRRACWSWLLAAFGLLSVWLGVVCWSSLAIVLGETPENPSWADPWFLLAYPLISAALVLRPIQGARDITRWPLMLDAGVALCALLAVSWAVALGPLFDRFGTGLLTQAVLVAYPLGDIGIVLCMVVLMLRETCCRPSTVLLIFGAGAVAVADSVGVALAATGTYTPGSWADVAWFAGIAVIGLGALIERPLPAQAPAGPYVGRCWQFVAPAGLVLLLGAVVWVVPLVQAGRSPGAGEAALAVAIVLLLARYVIGYRDRVRAHDLLARQTAEREAAQAAREEAACLEGVLLTARELAHLLNNDLAVVLGNVEMLNLLACLSVEDREALRDIEAGLDRMTAHLAQLQQVSRVRTRPTPVGPALDLATSCDAG